MKARNERQLLEFYHHIYEMKLWKKTDKNIFDGNTPTKEKLKYLYELSKNHYIEYNTNINENILVNEMIKNEKSEEDIKFIIKSMFNNKSSYNDTINTNKEWFINDFNEYFKERAITKITLDFIEINRSGDIEQFKKALNDAQSIFNNDVEEVEKNKKKRRFPINIFPKKIQDLISELNKTSGYNNDFLGTSIMSAISTLLGRKYILNYSSTWKEAPIFWFANIGGPGSKKSHPLSFIVEFIEKIDQDIYEQYIKTKTDDKEINKCKQHIIKDFTIEALFNVHDINKKGILVYRDELSGFLNSFDKYKSKGDDRQKWLELFNGKSIVINRVSKEMLRLNKTNINLIGTIQLDKLLQIFQGSDDGLTDRFLYTNNIKDRNKQIRTRINLKYVDDFNANLNAMVEDCVYVDSNDEKELFIDTKYDNLITDFDNYLMRIQTNKNTISRLDNYIEKIKTYLPRFILLLALMDFYFPEKRKINKLFDSPEIEERHIKGAFLLCKYFISTFNNLVIDLESKKEFNEIGEFNKKKGMTKKEKIISFHNKNFKQNQIAKELNVSEAYVSKIIKQFK